MHTNDEITPIAATPRGLRRRLSGLINAWLNRIGYAFVRIDNRHSTESCRFEGARYAYDNIRVLDVYAPWAIDADFQRVWRRASRNTLTDIYRCYELSECVREVRSVPGDILEVGVWRGGSAAILAAAAMRWMPAARLFLCDTFTGVVKAGAFDPDYRGGEHSDTSEAVVQDLMRELALTNVSIVQGIFPDASSDRVTAAAIALCHIDVDVYQSAVDIVAWVRPRMARGAMLVFDDYGFSTCKGITRCVDELRSSGEWIYFYNLNKHAVLIKK